MNRKPFSSIVSVLIAFTLLAGLAWTPEPAQAAPALKAARSSLLKGLLVQPGQAPGTGDPTGPGASPTAASPDPAAGEPEDLPAASPASDATASPLETAAPAAATAQCTPALRKIMPVGDSITRGSGDGSLNGYRKVLFDSLNALGYNIRFVGSQTDGTIPSPSDHHEGHGGYHAREDDIPAVAPGDIYHNIYGWLQGDPADVVLLHIGTNDVAFGDASSGEIGNILDEIDRYDVDSGGSAEDIAVVVAKIINQDPPIGAVTSLNNSVGNLVNNRINNWNDLLVLADMETPLYNQGGYYSDSLHPNVSGYAVIAQVWEEALYEVLPICAANDASLPAVLEDTPAKLTGLLTNDAGGGLKITGVGNFSNGGSAEIVDGGAAVQYTPAQNYSGSETFQYTLNNGGPNGSSATASVTLAITAVNDAPTTTADAQTVAEEGTLTFFAYILAGNDSPGPGDENWQSLSVTGVTATANTHGTVSLAGGNVSYKPEKDFAGAASFNYSVCDNGTPAACADGVVNVMVTNVNDAPTLGTIEAQNTPEDTPKTVAFTVNDVDTPFGDLAFSWETKPVGSYPVGLVNTITFDLSGQNRTFTITPGQNLFGEIDVTIKVSDGVPGGNTSSTFRFKVNAVEDPPAVSNPGPQSYPLGSQVRLQVTASDPEGKALIYLAQLPAGLNIDQSGLITGILGGSEGVFTATVTVIDAASKSTTVEFTITITKAQTRYIFMPLLLGKAYR